MVTKKELLEKLAEEGIIVSDRMFTHFISLGLIEKPVRFGLGKGRGSTAKFDDKVFGEIKEIVKLHKQGLTYEQIKQKRMSFYDWLSFVNQAKKSSKYKELIQRIPNLSDGEKGRLLLISDITERLTTVVKNELESIMGNLPKDLCELFLMKDLNKSIQYMIPTVIKEYGLKDDDYVEYLRIMVERKNRSWREIDDESESVIKSLFEKYNKGNTHDKKPVKGGRQKNGKNN